MLICEHFKDEVVWPSGLLLLYQKLIQDRNYGFFLNPNPKRFNHAQHSHNFSKNESGISRQCKSPQNRKASSLEIKPSMASFMCLQILQQALGQRSQALVRQLHQSFFLHIVYTIRIHFVSTNTADNSSCSFSRRCYT